MAISNSHAPGRVRRIVAALFLAFSAGIAAADDMHKVFADQAETELRRARTEFNAKTNDPVAAWQFARACFDRADFASNDNQRASLANRGIDVCRQVLARDPKVAAAHYYLAMNLGQLARTKTLGALKLVKEMEVEFKAAIELNDHLDFGGPSRSLGMLYRDAPGWPTSIGSKRKARMYLEQAAKIAPNFPENHMVLAESYLKWRDLDAAKQELDTVDKLWPDAQKSFTGELWERDWADWTERHDAVQKKLSGDSGPVTSPRNTR
jgi:tetratricopeptide (TPR) repeat protein